jgi:hypothetical protein
MDRTARWFLAASIVLLLVSSVLPAVAAPAPGGASGVNPSEPPAVFAERITARHGGYSGKQGSIQDAIELIVLATVCAIGVAFYSSATPGRDGTQVSMRLRRR